jgi:hypothetical protein
LSNYHLCCTNNLKVFKINHFLRIDKIALPICIVNSFFFLRKLIQKRELGFGNSPSRVAHTSGPSAGRPSTGRPSTGRPSAGRPITGRPSTGRPTVGRLTAGRPSTGRPNASRPISIDAPSPLHQVKNKISSIFFNPFHMRKMRNLVLLPSH